MKSPKGNVFVVSGMALFALAVPGKAGFVGDNVSVNYAFPDVGTVFLSGGSSVISSSGANISLNAGISGITVAVTNTNILVRFPAGWSFASVNKAFDGLVITDPAANIVGVSLASSSIPTYTASRLSFDTRHVYVDFLGLVSLAPGAAVSVDVQFASSVLPQFAFGGGWYSALYFTNTSASPASFPVNFTADDGTPLSVPSIGSSTTVTLAPRATAIIEAPNNGPLNQGYASFSLPPSVEAYGIFRQSVPGIADQEAVVLPSSGLSRTSTLIWDETNYITAVAIVNFSPVATTVNIILSDNNGKPIGTSSIALQPFAKTENTLRSYPGLEGIVGLRGSAQFTVSAPNVAMLGLRFNGAAFSSIPATQQ